MKKVRIHLVAGARPNFMKIAPIYHLLKNEPWAEVTIIHTGQHYDKLMSGAFLRELELPRNIVFLKAGSATRAKQIRIIRQRYERQCLAARPDCVIVVGDVNSTLACALTAKKLKLPVAHLEAGLRSRDLSMPEEINRIKTDAISDILWTPSPDADRNLRKEGISQERIVRIGNIMIDSYEIFGRRTTECEKKKNSEKFDLDAKVYGVVTLHRPVNVDHKKNFAKLADLLILVAQDISLVFPVHPRTLKMMEKFDLKSKIQGSGIKLLSPLNYSRFMSLVKNARFVITDSGGIQEETTYMGIPCLTLRESTERPITVTLGTNELVGPENLLLNVKKVLAGKWKKGRIPRYWDGHTAARAVKSLKKFMKVL
jgi:UDP-N-acetylglucosamine 2-epimerase (non-hydrolysing)